MCVAYISETTEVLDLELTNIRRMDEVNMSKCQQLHRDERLKATHEPHTTRQAAAGPIQHYTQVGEIVASIYSSNKK